MAHTFDIRFARSAGLAGLLEAPTNRYRWKGGGRLSIDGKGVHIAARGLATLFTTRAHHIAADQLTEVYREGDALRLTFQARESGRAELPFWAKDRDSAAEIVKLLPTPHTIEIEHSTQTQRRFRPDGLLLAWLATVIGIIVVGLVASSGISKGPASTDSMGPAPAATKSFVPQLPEQSGPGRPDEVRGAAWEEQRVPSTVSAGADASRVRAPSAVSLPIQEALDSGAGEDNALPAQPSASDLLDDNATASRVTAYAGGSLLNDITSLHEACVASGGARCPAQAWWDITERLHRTAPLDAGDHLFLAVSRAWRSAGEGGATRQFDIELAMALMNRAREWRLVP